MLPQIDTICFRNAAAMCIMPVSGVSNALACFIKEADCNTSYCPTALYTLLFVVWASISFALVVSSLPPISTIG